MSADLSPEAERLLALAGEAETRELVALDAVNAARRELRARRQEAILAAQRFGAQIRKDRVLTREVFGCTG